MACSRKIGSICSSASKSPENLLTMRPVELPWKNLIGANNTARRASSFIVLAALMKPYANVRERHNVHKLISTTAMDSAMRGWVEEVFGSSSRSSTCRELPIQSQPAMDNESECGEGECSESKCSENYQQVI